MNIKFYFDFCEKFILSLFLDYDQQISASAAWVPIILIFGSTVASFALAYKKTMPKTYVSYFIFPNYPSSKENNPSNLTTKVFNKCLAYYALFTFIAGLTLYILEPGKFWSSFSSLHNLLELIIILYLTLDGQFHKNNFTSFFICLTYVFLVNLLVTSFKWPLDSILFNAQGKKVI